MQVWAVFATFHMIEHCLGKAHADLAKARLQVAALAVGAPLGWLLLRLVEGASLSFGSAIESVARAREISRWPAKPKQF